MPKTKGLRRKNVKSRKFRKRGGIPHPERVNRTASQPPNSPTSSLEEDNQGHHIGSAIGCFGCESGVDNPSAHCSACNYARNSRRNAIMVNSSNVVHSDSDDEFAEDSHGYHIHSEEGCIGCESGVDNRDAHCTACRRENGTLGGGKRRKGYSIKINPKMKGVFTRKAKSHGMSVQKYAAYIIKKYKGKCKTKNELKLLRQAVFAKSSRKFKRKKSKKHKQKGGYCDDRYRVKAGQDIGKGTCRGGRVACCDARPKPTGDGNMCHFRDDLRREYATRIKHGYAYAIRGPLYLKMDREHKAYHNLEDRDPSKFFEPVRDGRGRVKRNRDGSIKYDKTKYKPHIAEEDIPTMQQIEFLRNQWYQEWYRPGCVTCDGNCTNHSARGAYAHQTHVDARGRREEGKERAAAAASSGERKARADIFDLRRDGVKGVEAALAENDYDKATVALDKLKATCEDVGTGGGCQPNKLAELEKQVAELGQTKPAAAPASGKQSWADMVEEDEEEERRKKAEGENDDTQSAGKRNSRTKNRKKRKSKRRRTSRHKRKSKKNKILK